MAKLLEFFCSDNGQSSMSRATVFMLVASFCIWATWIVFQTKTIPDLPGNIVWVIGVLYGINKIGGKIGAQNESANP
jgi:hypothetical protein